jgi:hypothetical protein
MTLQETAKLVALVTQLWQSFKIADGTVEAWHFALDDLDFNQVAIALKSGIRAGRFNREFPPTPMNIRTLVEESTRTVAKLTPAQIFEARDFDHSKLSQMAFIRWGGNAKFGMMPDPAYADDAHQCSITWTMEKNRYCEIYNSMVSHIEHDNFAEIHGEAKLLIENLSNLKSLGSSKKQLSN